MRRCHVLFRKVEGTEWPPVGVTHRGQSRSIVDVFEESGLRLDLEFDSRDLPELPRRFPFDLGNLHDWMLRDRPPRENQGPESPWMATVLIVPQIAYLKGTVLCRPFGVMFDIGVADRNQRPREGCAVAYHAVCNDPWIYFRTVAHELGHVFNLVHPQDDEPPDYTGDTLMFEIRDLMRRRGRRDDMSLSFSGADRAWLVDGPAEFVRPGGEPFGARPGKATAARGAPLD